MIQNEEFFAVRSEQSEIKAKIVQDYFSAWSRVIKKWNTDMGYIDLFCGPGCYGDNTESSPLIIIRKVLEDPFLTAKMHFLFNDEDEQNISQLRERIDSIDKLGALKKRIEYLTETVGDDFWRRVDTITNKPILSFVDPFGYKGLTMMLIDKLISNQGSDCIFFFNYNRVNMAFNNPKFDEHIDGLFGKQRAEGLRDQLKRSTAAQRERIVINALIESLLENKSNHVLPFKFYSTEKLRTSHFIVFVTKNPVACSIMKQIMHRYSAKDADGVATFTYEDSRNFPESIESEQLCMFSRPLQDLKDLLMREYNKQEVKVKDLCNRFDQSFETCFVGANVKDALRQIEENNQLSVISGRTRQTRNGKLNMPDEAIVRFL